VLCSAREGETCSAARGVHTEEGHAPDTTPQPACTPRQKVVVSLVPWKEHKECPTNVFSMHVLLFSTIIGRDICLLVYRYIVLEPGLWSRYTKPPTPTPQFLNHRLLHKSSICISNGKPTKVVNGIIRRFITTT
jgi:hypothetical protein